MNYSNLIIPSTPLVILPELAALIGINKAIILQQSHYWCLHSNHIINGRKWFYNTAKQWNETLFFIGESTIRKAIVELENDGYLISGVFNKDKRDRTKWYTVDYNKINDLYKNSPFAKNEQMQLDTCSPFAKNEQMEPLESSRPLPERSNRDINTPYIPPTGDRAIQEEKPKPKKPKSITAKREGIDYEAIAEYWNVNAKQNGLAKIMCMNSDRIKAVNKALDYPALKDKTTKGIKYLIWAFFQCASGWWFADDTKHNARLDTIFNNKNIEKWIDYVDQHSEAEQPENGDLF